MCCCFKIVTFTTSDAMNSLISGIQIFFDDDVVLVLCWFFKIACKVEHIEYYTWLRIEHNTGAKRSLASPKARYSVDNLTKNKQTQKTHVVPVVVDIFFFSSFLTIKIERRTKLKTNLCLPIKIRSKSSLEDVTMMDGGWCE